jgi:hypothetical protein
VALSIGTGGIVFPPDHPRQPIDILLVQIRGRSVPKKHSFRRSRDGFAHSEVVAGTPPKVHPQKTRKRWFQHPWDAIPLTLRPLDFQGSELAVSAIASTSWRRRPLCRLDVFSVSDRPIPCRAQPRPALTPGRVRGARSLYGWRFGIGLAEPSIPARQGHPNLALAAPRTERATIRPAPRKRAGPRLRWR